MNTYELAFITKDGEKKLLTAVEEILASFGATINQKDDWGEKPFAYRIGNLVSGHYHFWDLTIDPDKIKELKNRLNLENDLVRYLLLKNE